MLFLLHSFVSISCVLVEGISVDGSGNVYVVDSGNQRVLKWVPGAVVGLIVAGGNGLGSGANQLNWPNGMFLETASSTIWIADTNNHRIVKWASPSAGVVVCGSSGSGANQFSYPNSLFVDVTTSNTLYVADTSNHRIQKWLNGASNGTTVAGQTGVPGNGWNQLSNPQAVIVDTNGNIFISDASNNRIMRWAAGSSYGLPVAGGSSSGSLPNFLNSPQGLRFDSSGSLFTADFYNNRVQMFSISCRK
jgi:sugar lactone lactonase YvrE